MRHWGLGLTVIEGSLKLVPISYHGATCSCPQLELNDLCVLMETLACLVHTMENDLALLTVYRHKDLWPGPVTAMPESPNTSAPKLLVSFYTS